MQIPLYKSKWPFGLGLNFLINPVVFTNANRHLGKFYKVKLLPFDAYVLLDPEGVRQVLQVNHRHYHKSPVYSMLKKALGNGLVTSEGDFWRNQRQTIQPVFYKSHLPGLYTTMAKKVDGGMKKLAESIGEGATINIASAMMSITSDVVINALFSVENDAEQSNLYHIMNYGQTYIIDAALKFWKWPMMWIRGDGRTFKRYMTQMDTLIYQWIDERKDMAQPPADLLTLLLAASQNEDGSHAMTFQQMRDELVTLYSAGHETSANAMNWLLYALTQNTRVLTKLQAEIDQTLQGRVPSFEDIFQLTYTRQVIDEGLRMYPTAHAVGRQCVAPNEILQFEIPKDALVFIGIHAIHRDPEYWEKAEEFWPERWDVDNPKPPNKNAYLPFGAGPRMCIGYHFALTELTLLLASFVQRFSFSYAGSKPPTAEPLITLVPKGGMMIHIAPRVL